MAHGAGAIYLRERPRDEEPPRPFAPLFRPPAEPRRVEPEERLVPLLRPPAFRALPERVLDFRAPPFAAFLPPVEREPPPDFRPPEALPPADFFPPETPFDAAFFLAPPERVPLLEPEPVELLEPPERVTLLDPAERLPLPAPSEAPAREEPVELAEPERVAPPVVPGPPGGEPGRPD